MAPQAGMHGEDLPAERRRRLSLSAQPPSAAPHPPAPSNAEKLQPHPRLNAQAPLGEAGAHAPRLGSPGMDENERRRLEQKKKEEYARELDKQIQQKRAARARSSVSSPSSATIPSRQSVNEANAMPDHDAPAYANLQAATAAQQATMQPYSEQQTADDVAPREQEREAKKEWLVQQEVEQGNKANKVLGAGDGSDVQVRFRNDMTRLSRDELEAKQRQQSQYQAELQKQVEEKRRQREAEKQRRKEEERQEELRLQREQEQMRRAQEEERQKQKTKEQGQDVFDSAPQMSKVDAANDAGHIAPSKPKQTSAAAEDPKERTGDAEYGSSDAIQACDQLPSHASNATAQHPVRDDSMSAEIAKLREELQKEQRELLMAVKQQTENMNLMQNQQIQAHEQGVDQRPAQSRHDHQDKQSQRQVLEQQRQVEESQGQLHPQQQQGREQAIQTQSEAAASVPIPPQQSAWSDLRSDMKCLQPPVRPSQVDGEESMASGFAYPQHTMPNAQSVQLGGALRQPAVPLQSEREVKERDEPPRTRGGRPVTRADDALASESKLVYPGRDVELLSPKNGAGHVHDPSKPGDTGRSDPYMSQELTSFKAHKAVHDVVQENASFSNAAQNAPEVQAIRFDTDGDDDEYEDDFDYNHEYVDPYDDENDSNDHLDTEQLESLQHTCEQKLTVLNELEQNVNSADPATLKGLMDRMTQDTTRESSASPMYGRPSTASELDRRGESRFV